MKKDSSNRKAHCRCDTASPESITYLFDWFEELIKLKKFIRTYRSIDNGKKLFNYSSKQIANHEVMGPWSFKLYQAILTSLPLQIFILLYGFFLPNRNLPDYKPAPSGFGYSIIPLDLTPIAGIDQNSPFWRAAVKLFPSVAVFFQLLFVSVSILALTWVIAWVFSDKTARSRTKYAYLYYDGTYGFIPQVMMQIGFAFIIYLKFYKQYSLSEGLMAMGALSLIGISWVYQLYLTFYKIPKILYQLKVSTRKPGFRTAIALYFLGLISLLLIQFAFLGLCYGITFLLALIQSSVVAG